LYFAYNWFGSNDENEEKKIQYEDKYAHVKRLPVGRLTLDELSRYSGANNSRIFVSICGRIFDLCSNHETYGPQGTYDCFPGGDISFMLAKMSFKETDKNKKDFVNTPDWDGEAHVTLSNWIANFRGRFYPVVGRLDGYEKIGIECWRESGYDDEKPNNETNKMTLAELKKKKEYLVSVGGYIFDVGPAASVFSYERSDIPSAIGHDITLALIKSEYKKKKKNYNQPLTTILQNNEYKKILKPILKTFRDTYVIVGRVDDPSFAITLDD